MAFTKPNDLELAQTATKEFFTAMEGKPSAISKLTGKPPSEVITWRKRGYVSKPAAVIIEQAFPGKFTKQQLRPDVKKWL